MSNIRLTGNYWTSDSVYDTTKSKTQKDINAELYSLIDDVGPSGGSGFYGMCSTAASVAAKVVTEGNTDDFACVSGASVYIYFTYAVPDNATLNIKSTGAHPIKINGVNVTAGEIDAGDTCHFIYDGTNYTVVSVDRWGSDIVAKADLASPAFTGVPTAPTASSETNTTQIATTAFVQTAIGSKANLASPTFTGTPAAPTATAGTNTTQIATTAFVSTAISSAQSTLQTSINAKQTKNLYFTSVSVAANKFASNTTYSGYGYRGTVALSGVTASMYAEVIFAPTEALSGNYAPVCQTYAGGVYIYSKVNTAITIPSIVVFP